MKLSLTNINMLHSIATRAKIPSDFCTGCSNALHIPQDVCRFFFLDMLAVRSYSLSYFRDGTRTSPLHRKSGPTLLDKIVLPFLVFLTQMQEGGFEGGSCKIVGEVGCLRSLTHRNPCHRRRHPDHRLQLLALHPCGQAFRRHCRFGWNRLKDSLLGLRSSWSGRPSE